MSESAPDGAIQGRIDPERPIQTHLARALLPLVRGKRTGALALITPGPRPSRTQIVLADGHVVFAESETDAGGLLRALSGSGKLGAPQAMRLERRVLEDRGWSGLVRASELAVSEGKVPPNVAQEVVSEIVHERVRRALAAREGEWAYQDDPRAASVPRYPVAFERVVLEALGDPEEAPRYERALERYLRHYPRLEGDRQENTTQLGLSPARFRTMRLLDGAHTLSEVLAQSPMGATEAAAFVAGLTIFERIWWNPTPSPKAPSGVGVGTQRPGPPRPVTMERPPTAIEELRALGARPTTSPGAPPRGPSELRMPTPTARPQTTPGPRPPSSPGAASSALVQELLRRGRVPPASSQGVPATRPVSQTDLTSAGGHFDRGKTHLSAGRLGPASQEFARALEMSPGDTAYLLHARFAAYLLGSGDRAALESELLKIANARAREVETDDFPHHVLGRLAFDKGDDERARRELKHAERLAPKDLETQRYLRLLASRSKR